MQGKDQLKRTLLVILDGLGIQENSYGNAVHTAYTPNLDWLMRSQPYTQLKAHGTFVGLPSNNDIGNSEVGHNALGAGRIVDQGAKLVSHALASKRIFTAGSAWEQAMQHVSKFSSTLHFLGLLSDGNVHSHQDHLFQMIHQAVQQGIRKIRLHILFDGRDVEERSAKKYIDRLEQEIQQARITGVDIAVASAGGRMVITMDRYEADWSMVQRGWDTHVHGKGPGFCSLSEGLLHHEQQDPECTDQYIPPYVIHKNGAPVGKIIQNDAVIFFNFRGDRAIQISQAFEEDHFPHFERHRPKNIFYAGMMEYDGDRHIPKRYLVSPPNIQFPLAAYLAERRISQFACSETQKYGHVTYFWNGNKSGYFDEAYEKYLEIPSDLESFDKAPWMKAKEITDATIAEMADPKGFMFGRINFANPDMVGHTGDFAAAVNAVGCVDQMLGRLLQAARKYNVQLVITADHGNCDEMYERKSSHRITNLHGIETPPPKTSHTKAPVPLVIYDPQGTLNKISLAQNGNLGNVANTVLQLMGLSTYPDYQESLIR
ncbi:MAG: 2,3-bisphosphoglycerate-independent phosphoglycerate mutase [Zetaproteobacteria bacterium]|nr:2,3-bisphosphoglycerate-independent phosphoglycerate mutase [Zetaproteobacteria bacterium]